MAITLRQTYTTASKTQTNVSVQAGDLIWVGFDITGSMIETNCADNAAGGSNVYDPPDSGFELYGDHVKVFYAKAKATETLTITITTANSSGPRIFVHVYSGCDTSLANVLNGVASHVDTSAATAHATADLTTTNADDLLLTFWIQVDTTTTISENGTGFTRRITVGGMGTFDKTVSSTGTYHEDVTSTVATRYGSYIMAFKAAAAVAPVNPLRAEIQTLTPSAILEMFVLDATALGGALYRFHGGTNSLGGDLVWQGNTYTRYPIQASGFEMTSKGIMPRPTVKIANVDGAIAAQIRAYGDLVGAKVTRKRTLAKFLDAVNFPGGNVNADPTAQFADDVFYVERKVTENQLLIEFELSAACDLQGLLLPRRIVQASCCMWNDAAVCAYSVGGQCAKTLEACKGRWGGQRTNLQIQSNNFNVGPWIKSGRTVTTSTDNGPDGAAGSASLCAGSGGVIYQPKSTDLNGILSTHSVWVKQAPTGSATNIRLTTNDSVGWNTGGVSQRFPLTTSWQRISLSSTVANTIIGAVDAAGVADATCNGNFLLAFSQFEAGSVPTSYIPTLDTPVTVTGDDLPFGGFPGSGLVNA